MHLTPETYDVTTTVHSSQYAVKWEANGARFHVWMRGPGEIGNDLIVYKNPPLGVQRRAENWFETRRMKLNSAAWSQVTQWLLTLPEGDFTAAQEAARIAENAKKSDRQAKALAEDMETLSGLLAKHFPHVSLEDLQQRAAA